MSDEQAPTAEPEIRYLGDLQRLEVKPGDRFVLMVPGVISLEMGEMLREYFKTFVPDAQVLVLAEGMKLGVIGPASEVPSS